MFQEKLGACFEIKVDGKCRTYRDLIHDLRDNSMTVIDGATIVAFDLAAARKR